MTSTWSQSILPPIVIGIVLSIVPVGPFLRLRNSPSTYMVTPVDVSTHVRLCHCSSLSGVRAPVATWPPEPLKRQVGIPSGAWIFHCPPLVWAWPFWVMFPKCSPVR